MYQAHQVYFNMKFSQCFVEAMFNDGDSWYGWLRFNDIIEKEHDRHHDNEGTATYG